MTQPGYDRTALRRRGLITVLLGVATALLSGLILSQFGLVPGAPGGSPTGAATTAPPTAAVTAQPATAAPSGAR